MGGMETGYGKRPYHPLNTGERIDKRAHVILPNSHLERSEMFMPNIELEEVTNDWPDCPIEGCPNKICLALDSEFCFPHTPGNERVKHIDIDVRLILREKQPVGAE